MNKLKSILYLLIAGSILTFFILSSVLLLLAVLIPVNWIWLIPYLIYIYFDDTQYTGGRRLNILHNSVFHRSVRNYFNTEIIRTKELDPKKNYLFAYHPHGIFGLGCFPIVGNLNPNWERLFPGLDTKVLTLNANFWIPLYREVVLALGLCSVSKHSIKNILQSGPSRSCVLVPGGGREVLSSDDSKAELVLRNRLGFVKVAIQTGAQLVPVYGFGETSTYTTQLPQGNYYFDLFQSICKQLGARFVIFYGRGLSKNSVGMFPHKVKMTIVVGNPIPIKKNPNPSNEEVEYIHKVYCDELIKLYDSYKHLYHTGPLPVPDLKLI